MCTILVCQNTINLILRQENLLDVVPNSVTVGIFHFVRAALAALVYGTIQVVIIGYFFTYLLFELIIAVNEFNIFYPFISFSFD